MLALKRGVPHNFNNVVLYKNSIGRKAKDQYPLSAYGQLQKYVLLDGQITYSALDLHSPRDPWITKGLTERSIAPLANFSNTGVYEHGSKLYTTFETKPMLQIDPEQLKVDDECIFDNDWCRFASGHCQMDDLGNMWTFANIGSTLHVMCIDKEGTARTKHSIDLGQSVYCHSFLLTDSWLIFPTFPCTIDITRLLLGRRSVVESVQFDYANSCVQLLMIHRTSGKSVVKHLHSITSPAFHIEGDDAAIYLFATNEQFSFDDITSAAQYTSSCVRYDFAQETFTTLPIQGDMPAYDAKSRTLAYASSSGLVFVREEHSKVVDIGCPTDEPQLVRSDSDKLYAIQVSHPVDGGTDLHVIDALTGVADSVYTMDHSTPQGVHGFVSYALRQKS